MNQVNSRERKKESDSVKLTKERAMWQRRKNELIKIGVSALDQEFLAKHLRECEQHLRQIDSILSAGS